MNSCPRLDLTLYLVTDSTPEILGDKNIVHVVEEALEGGVTIVQYRDKHAETCHMIDVAKRLHAVTVRHGVPLLINDRVDVALAAGVEGVHIGQDDIDIAEARRILPEGSIIGVTASSIDEASKAIKGGADYLGVGTMFGTPTKKDTKLIIGTQGTRAILSACKTGTRHSVPCVAIGGINASNVQRVLHQTASEHLQDINALNGVAVVSAVMAASDARAAARKLRDRIELASTIFYTAISPGTVPISNTANALPRILSVIRKHAKASTLCHNMTNTVVQNFAANVCLAVGSSPIMSMNAEEATDLAGLGGALVINMGTVTPDVLNVYLAGVKAYNEAGNPVLLDPVGGGATTVRKEAIKLLLKGGFFSVIKGNEGEINAVMGVSSVQQRGVDSGPSTSTSTEKADLVKSLAIRERCVVLMSGATDYLSDGQRTVAISNGSHWLGQITGSGCSLGSVIASYIATDRSDKFIATLAGILHYEIAAERAAANAFCNGPGSFTPKFVDELYHVREMVSKGESAFLESNAKLDWL